MPLELEAFGDPAKFVPGVNDGGLDVTGRSNNCADCARAVQLCWEGRPSVSAARVPGSGGESSPWTTEWSGKSPERADFDAIAARLTSGGHGSSAIVHVQWNNGRGHAFNAVNLNGKILFIDGQPGAYGPWPPSKDSPGYRFDESETVPGRTVAWYF
jgi:hypothetical protein